MRFGVLGTGIVGRTIGSRLAGLEQPTRMGSRSADNEKASEWARSAGEHASHGTFAEAAAFGAVIFNCTAGVASLGALELAGAENLAGKLLIDVANPLDFSRGFPPSLTVCNTDSLGEQIQAAFPGARVVKALNTMNCEVMVHPERVRGEHDVFLGGNDAAAKAETAAILTDLFGWPRASIIDLGDITTARGTEMMLPVWVRLWGVLQTGDFNFHVAR